MSAITFINDLLDINLIIRESLHSENSTKYFMASLVCMCVCICIIYLRGAAQSQRIAHDIYKKKRYNRRSFFNAEAIKAQT